MIASSAFGWYVLFADEYMLLGNHIAAGAGFVSNFLLWSESGYFDNAAEAKPLLHLWSLAIEEQFYIFWPLLLAFVWQRKWSFFFVTLLVAVASFAANIYAVNRYPVAAFYFPLPRFWELMIGCLLAYIVLHKPKWSSKNKNLQSTLGLMFLSLGFVFINNSRAFPGWWALLPTLGAFFIVSAGPSAWLNRRVLSAKLLVWFGLISYPLYLWHWPILSFAHIVENAMLTRQVKIVAIMISIVLAWLTYALIEKPLRVGRFSALRVSQAHRRAREGVAFPISRPSRSLVMSRWGAGVMNDTIRWFTMCRSVWQRGFVGSGVASPSPTPNMRRRQPVITLFVLMGCVLVSGMLMSRNIPQSRNYNSPMLAILQAVRDWQYPKQLRSRSHLGETLHYIDGQSADMTVFLGDSHVEQYSPRIVYLASGNAVSTNTVVFATGGGCLPIPSVHEDAPIHRSCNKKLQAGLDFIERDRVKVVVVGACWSCGFIWETGVKKKIDDYDYYFLRNGIRESFRNGNGPNLALIELEAMLKSMSRKKEVYLLLDNPGGVNYDPHNFLALGGRSRLAQFSSNASVLPVAEITSDQLQLRDRMISMATRLGIKIIDPYDKLCGEKYCLRMTEGGEPLYMDSSHLQPLFVRRNADYIDSAVLSR